MAENSINSNQSKASHNRHKWKKRSVVILSIFIFLITFVIVMIYTSLGVKLTMFALNKFLPELKIEQVDGTFHNLHIKGLSLNLTGVNVSVDDASLELSGSCLIQTVVCLKHFNADGVNVNVNTQEI